MRNGPPPDKDTRLYLYKKAYSQETGKEFDREAEPPPGNFSAGDVISLTISNFCKTPLFYISLAYLAALPGLWLAFQYRGRNASTIASLLDMFISVLFMGAISYGVYQNMIGERAQLGRALLRGMSSYLSLVGVSLLYFLALIPLMILGALFGMLGMMVVGIVIIFFALMWSVATPACVVERLGPVNSMSRSAELTKGRRGSIFGLFFIYMICVGVAQFLIATVFPGTLGFRGPNVAQLLVEPFFNALVQVLCATLYYQLRVAREGVSVDKLANVFA